MLEADCALRHYTPAHTINPMQRQYHGKRARDKARAVPSRLGASGAVPIEAISASKSSNAVETAPRNQPVRETSERVFTDVYGASSRLSPMSSLRPVDARSADALSITHR